ncbi:NAD-dependent epimerase/dehydratase family protein [Roseivivax sp. GX 12232]|uniref:polysaccharide biosynthesis C-terminal domain-containing protein n=1 Tax=Roseivivax sp. GX 12232 TaxID=2900547 RepID=UPI001E2B86BB|nr:NAD-dependent epimerase/dehydratase family protein [Roseivivax sp. GX 12232]MCE0506576.1 NAD-dependent epimerase/dehydratase family protein [Roseivivax sp. GX 12232]
MKRIVVTGAGGLLGFHASAHLHAANCAARFRDATAPFELLRLDRAGFETDATLQAALTGADIVLHFAGVNRGDPAEVEAANPAIAQRLVTACQAVAATPHVVYANSVHAAGDTPYGRGKAAAARILASSDCGFTDLVLPHIFGEGARPFYNNVTATLIDRVLKDITPDITPDGRVNLLHAGAAVDIAIDAALAGRTGQEFPAGRAMSVPDLYARLLVFHDGYVANIYPALTDDFDVALFNTYRAATYPDSWPRPLKMNTDSRGTLFEAVKGGGGQTFLSTTHPGITRGDHFHLSKVERFLVVQGEAVIRMRRVLDGTVQNYHVTGDAPAPVDMPTLYTHSIENVGSGQLLTLFWTHDLFDPQHPDTFADKVLS